MSTSMADTYWYGKFSFTSLSILVRIAWHTLWLHRAAVSERYWTVKLYKHSAALEILGHEREQLKREMDQ